jgi:hypothetical protein
MATTAPVLTLHRGGRDPREIAKTVSATIDILRELEAALPISDYLRRPAGMLADALAADASLRALDCAFGDRA